MMNVSSWVMEKGGFCDADSQLERWRPLLDVAGPRRWSSVARRVASFPGVGLGAQTLPLPDHRLDHRVWGIQLPGHVVLLDQPVHDALVGGRAEVKLGAAESSRSGWGSATFSKSCSTMVVLGFSWLWKRGSLTACFRS